MNKLRIPRTLIFSFLFLLFNVYNLAQENNIKTWTDTSVPDFFKGTLDSLKITDITGGEIQIPHPMVKKQYDIQDNLNKRFIATNSDGNFVRAWYGRDINVQRYSKDSIAISDIILIESSGSETTCRVALLNDGYYIVVWADIGINGDNNMYGQILNNNDEKVGSYFQINNVENIAKFHPVVFANEADSTFWIFFPQYTVNGYKTYVQKRDKNAQKVGETFILDTGNIVKNEYNLAVAGDNASNFIITWAGSDSNISTYVDVYLRKYDSSGSPINLPRKVNDDNLLVTQIYVDICSDNSDNFLAVWGDMRNNISDYGPIIDIYGQYISHDGNFVGTNFKVNNATESQKLEPDVIFINNEFQISYLDGYKTYLTAFRYIPILNGIYTSKIFDTGRDSTIFHKIYWNKSYKPNTSIYFMIRSANSVDLLSTSQWVGPTDTSDFFTLNSGEDLPQFHSGNRYIQYKAHLSTEIIGKSPILNSVTISYTPIDTIPPLTPENFHSISGNSQLELVWDNVNDIDIAQYRIYKGLASKQYDLDWTVDVPFSENSYVDYSVQNGKNY